MDYRVYIITAELRDLNRTHLDVAKAAIEGGATIIQFREKNKETREMIKIAQQLRQLTHRENIPLIINDRLDVALAVEADGVHLGQNDMPLNKAREITSSKMIIGVSATNLTEALEAQKEGASYVGVGPIFPTPSKKDAAEPIGIKELIRIREAITIPIVAIGGITMENIDKVLETGVDGVAVISAVACAPNMIRATREIRRMVEEKLGG